VKAKGMAMWANSHILRRGKLKKE